MGISNYPNGFPNGLTLREVPTEVPHPGKVFWVNNSAVLADKGIGGSDGNKGSYQQPFATIDYAIGRCTASRGDVIYVMPGHAETVTATSIALDVAGVSIIGLGKGDLRPTLTYSTAAATITVSAANCSIVNVRHVANKLDVASAVTLGAAKAFTLLDNLFEETSSILNFLSIVTTGATDNDADDLTVSKNVWHGLNTTPLAMVSILQACVRPNLSNNAMFMAATSGAEFLTMAAKVVTAATIADNIQVVVGATGTTTGIFLTGSATTCSGIVKGNLVSSLDTTSELLATAGTKFVYHENYYTGVADKSGKLWPVVDAA